MTDEAKLEGGHTTRQIPEGSMFLYEKPEILTKEDHNALGITPLKRPFDFASKIQTVPLVATEIASAQKSYPVIFSNPDDPQAFAVVSVVDNNNMFVDDSGNWFPFHYIPAYLRRYPFAFAKAEGDQLALVIDRASEGVTETPEFPFFDGDALSAETQKIVDFCSKVEGERQRSIDFTAKLKELDLLDAQEITQGDTKDEEQVKLASYYAVSTEKLNKLSPEVLQDLNERGYLSFIYAHLFSMENWGKLIERRARMELDSESG
ncbi:MAG: peptidase [Gammaproteobacteria bacterium]|nr:peptidase [Gammaproteobacteria bacterium]|tara:strand:- start:416 stop:1204 length:789 start_codon:yes stop_codon:yes gene_type:complete